MFEKMIIYRPRLQGNGRLTTDHSRAELFQQYSATPKRWLAENLVCTDILMARNKVLRPDTSTSGCCLMQCQRYVQPGGTNSTGCTFWLPVVQLLAAH
jgi:hypothetical protein